MFKTTRGQRQNGGFALPAPLAPASNRVTLSLVAPTLLAPTLLALALAACGGNQVQPEAAVPVAQAAEAKAAAKPPQVVQPITERCDTRLQNARSQRDALAKLGKGPRSGPADYSAAALNALNEMGIALDLAASEASLFFAVHPDKAVREAAAQCEQQTEALRTEISLDRRLYDAIAGLDAAKLPADEQRLIKLTLRDFRLAGVDKDEATRARITKLKEELVTVGQSFEKGIAGDVRKVKLDVAQLTGLPADWIAAHKPGADGKVEVSTDYPDYIPMMQYAEDDAARKELYLVYRQRGWPTNRDNLQRILEIRAELAKLTGFDNWAAYATADKMIKTDKAIADFIEKVSKAAEPRMKSEYAMLLAELQKADPKATEVGDWQQGYLLGKLKKQNFAFDAQAMRPYLHYDKVKAGLLDLTSKLFGIRYVRNTKAEIWHPEVEAYDVFEGDQLYGRIFLDMHPREGKYKHAAQFTLVSGIEGRQIPEGVLVCNFPSPKSGNGLMEHKDVETFFHEFGHLMHHVLGGHQKWARFSGVATEWDFVEAPSQIFEEWAKDYATLKAFAVDDKGQVLPKELMDKLVAADNFGKALWVRHQMFYAGLSLAMHNRDPKSIDQDKLVEEIQGRYSPYKMVPETHMQASFGHLNGYSAIYYTYMWSMVISKDLFSRFQKEGILEPKVAMRYRQMVLGQGGSKDAADLVADFLERPYDFGSYAAWLNQAGSAAPKAAEPAAGKGARAGKKGK